RSCPSCGPHSRRPGATPRHSRSCRSARSPPRASSSTTARWASPKSSCACPPPPTMSSVALSTTSPPSCPADEVCSLLGKCPQEGCKLRGSEDSGAEAAVDVDGGAGDIGRGVGAEEDDDAGDLLGCAVATEGDPLRPGGEHGFFVTIAGVGDLACGPLPHRCADQPRKHRV